MEIKENREPGIYWVCLYGVWETARWYLEDTGIDNGWWEMLGRSGAYDTDYFSEIDPIPLTKTN